MATSNGQPWYVSKRAKAFVYSLWAGRDLVVREQEPQEAGVDFVLDLRKGRRESGRSLAVQLVAFVDFPAEKELHRIIAKRFPPEKIEDFVLPLVLFAVQVRELAALYTWVLEPVVEHGEAVLCTPAMHAWEKLDDRAMDAILAAVGAFWEGWLKQVKV